MSKKCQVFTSPEQVVELLDATGYINNLYGKRVLENSCGKGIILIEICKRYIANCISLGYSISKIKNGLERDIVGYEIDKELYSICITNLNKLVADYGILKINWQIYCRDALKDNMGYFDYVIGNPPYISYNDMNLVDRCFLKDNFFVCRSGRFDYYYAFVQSGIERLKKGGVLAYILPSSIYKNVSGMAIRKLILPYVTDVYDYSICRQFGNIATSSTILICKISDGIQNIAYHDVLLNKSFLIKKSILSDKWYFTNKMDQKNGKRFGDYFKVAYSIATLCNEAFLIEGAEYTDGYYRIDGEMLEEELIAKAISTKNARDKKEQLIIFPYLYDDNNNLKRIDEKKLKEEYPGIYSHLYRYKELLIKRSSNKNVAWYEYGRTQGLAYLNNRKLVTSSVITNSFPVVLADDYDVPFAGIYIQQKRELSLEYARDILQSKEFWKYITVRSINSVGKSSRISVKDICDYFF